MDPIAIARLFMIWLWMIIVIVLPIEAGMTHEPLLLVLAIIAAYVLIVRISPLFSYEKIEEIQSSNEDKEDNNLE